MMTDHRLIYHKIKFEEIVLRKKDNLQCRIWTKQAESLFIDKLSDPNPKTLKDMLAIQNFELIEVMGINNRWHRNEISYSKLMYNYHLNAIKTIIIHMHIVLCLCFVDSIPSR